MSLNGEYDQNNVFAQILRGEIPAAKVMENEFILSFMDMFPQSTGHTLVIPKNGGRNLLDTNEDDLIHVICAVKRISAAVNRVFKPDGIAIAQFNGKPAGQTVFHMHFHIIPKYQNQHQNQPAHGTGQMADIDEMRKQADKIAKAID